MTIASNSHRTKLLNSLHMHLLATLPEYLVLNRKMQSALVSILLTSYRMHSTVINAVAIPNSLLTTMGLDIRTFHTLNTMFQLFGKSDVKFSHSKGECQAWFPGSRINEILRGFYLEADIASEKRPKRVPKVHYHTDTKVNVEALSAQYDVAIEESEKLCLNGLLVEAKANNGCISGFYSRATSGRLYGIGVNLQNANREIRTIALSGMGYYDIDIENCHLSLLWAFYQGEGMRYCLENKALARQTLADACGVSVAQVKTALISLFYGVGTRCAKTSGLTKELGDKVEVFLSHKIVKDLLTDLKIVRKILIESPEGVKALKLIRAKDLKGMRDSQKMSHILQNLESRVLRACMSLIDIDVLLHDGWITTVDVDVNTLSILVKKATGLSVVFSKERM